MAYFTGSANSWSDLLNALTSSCVSEGWTWADGILSKGDAFIMPWIRSPATSTEGEGILLQGGTGKSGSTLLNPSPQSPRMGCPSRDISQVVWPVEYYIHIHADPDEVYFIARYSVDYFIWCAFGLSSLELPGSGLWVSATGRRLRGPIGPGIRITDMGGGGNQGGDSTSPHAAGTTGALLWNSNGLAGGGGQSAASQNHAVCTGFDSTLWPFPTSNSGAYNLINTIHANVPLSPLIVRSNAWNHQSVLLPIQPTLVRAENKVSKVADLAHARYVRVDNFEPGQIISLGAEQWRVYPFYRKQAGVTSVDRVDHTGAFGMAIRYDGP